MSEPTSPENTSLLGFALNEAKAEYRAEKAVGINDIIAFLRAVSTALGTVNQGIEQGVPFKRVSPDQQASIRKVVIREQGLSPLVPKPQRTNI